MPSSMRCGCECVERDSVSSQLAKLTDLDEEHEHGNRMRLTMEERERVRVNEKFDRNHPWM